MTIKYTERIKRFEGCNSNIYSVIKELVSPAAFIRLLNFRTRHSHEKLRDKFIFSISGSVRGELLHQLATGRTTLLLKLAHIVAVPLAFLFLRVDTTSEELSGHPSTG